MKVLITGATGFVGKALLQRLELEGYSLRAAVRTVKDMSPAIEQVVLHSTSEISEYNYALRNIDAVVHLAARTHVTKERSTDSLMEYRKVNTAVTECLAQQAAAKGVKRIVFLSSVKVNGEGSTEPYMESDLPAPEDPYGVSKREAEDALRKVAADTGLEVVIIRSPLVYGPGVKANFLRLLDVVWHGIPLPLGSIRNRRSFIYLGNLVDAIVTCIAHPEAAGKTYLVSDCEDVSTPEMIQRVANALDKPAKLLSFPPGLLRLAGRFTSQSAMMVERLCGSLQVESSKIRRELGWTPPFTMEQGLKATAEWYTANTVKGKR